MRPYLLFLILVSMPLLFFHLGARPLLSSGEPRASEIAIEMLQRGNLLVPYFNEEILLTKPLLFHWFIILSYKIFGVSEFSSRFPSGIAGILVVVIVYLLGKRCWDRKTGFIAGLILVTSPLFFWSARCARIDSLFLFLITISIYCFWRGYGDIDRGRWWFLCWFLFMGLGMLAKGPVGVLVPLGTAVLFLLFVGKKDILKRLNWFWGLFIFFIIVSPWFIAIYFLVPQHKSELFFLQQIWAWLTGGGEWYKGYVYIPHLFLGFFPWSLAIPVVFLYYRRGAPSPLPLSPGCPGERGEGERGEKTVFLWIWVFMVFFFFAFFGKKVSRYILPLYPAISLLTAREISSRRNTSRIFSFALVVVWILIILAVDLYAGFLEPELAAIIGKYTDRLWVSAIGVFVIALGIYGIKKAGFAIPWAISFASLFMFLIYAIPIERDYYSPKPFCEMLKDEVPEDAMLRAYRSWDNSIRYYLGRHVDIMRKEDELLGFLDSGEKVYCFMWEGIYSGLPQEIKEKVFVAKTGYKVLEHKVVLVSNRE